ncbi:MAG TPA: NTP transferase domain-containing protein [candidate division Zixibacteria bacterium]|nr:NTP transferase domain-containing protein [candidate division Zixibacteria bacterium]
MPQNKSKKYNVSGIILSGGSSSRFQLDNEPWQDKALVRLEHNEYLLQKILSTLSSFCNEIIIVVKNKDAEYQYKKSLSDINPTLDSPVKFVKDNPTFLCSGPSLGIITGLNAAKNDFAVIAPVDMPNLSSKIFQELLSNLDSNSLAVPLWESTGKIEPLVFAIKVKEALLHGSILSLIRRSRADDLHRGIESSKYLVISNLITGKYKRLFASINNRISLFEISNGNLDFPGEIFETSILITKTRKHNTLKELEKILTKYSFLKPSEKTIKEIIFLADQLEEFEHYFYSGLILYNLLELIKNSDEKLNEKYKQIIAENCINSFISEANYWNNKGITFLEFHSYLDARSASRICNNLEKVKELTPKINNLMEKMNLQKKEHKNYDFNSTLKNRLPTFLEKVKVIIKKSEQAFNEKSPPLNTDFLWDHSYRVGKIAHKLALSEGANPLIPTLGALLHDAGKFVLGNYHLDSISEEEHSANLAHQLLKDEGLSKDEIQEVLVAIRGIYDDSLECNQNCKIIHDADRLEKLGPLGIANFFTKSTLRGVNLSSAVITSLSRELTYAYMSPKTMKTESGKKLAEIRSKMTIDYFISLLEELRTFDIGSYSLKYFSDKKYGEFILVIPEKCTKCQGEFLIDLSSEKGTKCEKLVANYSCNTCNEGFKVQFCLPLIIS